MDSGDGGGGGFPPDSPENGSQSCGFNCLTSIFVAVCALISVVVIAVYRRRRSRKRASLGPKPISPTSARAFTFLRRSLDYSSHNNVGVNYSSYRTTSSIYQDDSALLENITIDVCVKIRMKSAISFFL